MRPFRLSSVVLAATLILAPMAPAHGQADGSKPGPEHKTILIKDPLRTAAALIDRGRYTDAALILDAIDQMPAQDRAKFDATERAFLRGRIAFGKGDYKTAIQYYEAILAKHPEVVRVRLELARSLLMDGEYDRAERDF